MQLMSTRLKFFSIISKITFLSNLILFFLIYRYSKATDITCQTREIVRAITKNRDAFMQKKSILNASQKGSLTQKNLFPLSQVLSCVQGDQSPNKRFLF